MAYITRLEEELESEILQLKQKLEEIRGFGKNKVIQGDCLEVLKGIPDNYFDSLITDPPAGISFMGKNWDDHKGGMFQWINWMSEVMSESLRVMKPGACGLVWSIPRTSHWTGMALELAGFRLIDCVHHCFGCLSEDTEIFVKDKGWVHYQQCEIGDIVIGYNIENNSFSYQNVTKTYRFDYSDTAYRIESDSTEQIVSIGHRCIIEQNGAFVFREATTLEQQVSVPFLETMPFVQHAISDTQRDTSDQKHNLFRELCEKSDCQSQHWKESTAMCLPRVSDRVLPQNKSINSEILLSDMRGQGQKEKSKNVRHLKNIAKLGRAGWTEKSMKSYAVSMGGENNPAWKGGVTIFKKKGNYKNVRYVRCPKDYLAMARKDGYVMEHRLIMAQQVGRVVLRTEAVHHINHNPTDNRIENLMLFQNNRDHKLYEHGNRDVKPLWQP